MPITLKNLCNKVNINDELKIGYVFTIMFLSPSKKNSVNWMSFLGDWSIDHNKNFNFQKLISICDKVSSLMKDCTENNWIFMTIIVILAKSLHDKTTKML